MVKQEDLTEIGYTKKIHGLKGELKAMVHERYLEDFVSAKLIFLQLNSSLVPYFIENVRIGNEIILKLEDVSDVGSAKVIQSKKIFHETVKILPPEKRKIAIKGEEYLDIEGFEMKTIEGELIGTIIEKIKYPSQEMAVVVNGKVEKLVPLIASFIKEIDRQNKLIIVDLPEGLLDL